MVTTTLRRGRSEGAALLPDRLALMRTQVRSWVDRGLTQAIVYLIARRGIIAAEEAAGQLTYCADSPPVALDSLFSLASLAKPITASAVMMLVEDGAVSLNRPLVEYIPEMHGKGSEGVFVHHLLTHTSGFRASDATRLAQDVRSRRTAQLKAADGRHPAIDLLLEAYCGLEPAQVPGRLSCYCGANYVLLGEVVRRAAGKSLPEFARERIFKPLGMTSTAYGLPAAFAGRRVQPDPAIYVGFPGYNPNDPEHLAIPHPAGGVFSTAQDLAVFGQTFLNGGTYGTVRLLSQASVRLMTTNQIFGVGAIDSRGHPVPEASWGFGWMVQGNHHWNRWMYSHGSLPSVGTFYHEGASGAAIWIDPRNDLVGVYLSIISALDPETEEFKWEFDRFQNMVTAAIAD